MVDCVSDGMVASMVDINQTAPKANTELPSLKRYNETQKECTK